MILLNPGMQAGMPGFLKLLLSAKVCVCVCVCVCVPVRPSTPRLLLASGMILTPYDRLNYRSLTSHGIGNCDVMKTQFFLMSL